MMILALDLATRTGWASGLAGGRPRYGLFRVVTGSQSSDGCFFTSYRNWLWGAIDAFRPSVLAYEAPILDPRKTAHQTAFRLMGLAALTEEVGYDRKIQRVCSVDASTVKKHFTGYGRADKQQMVKMACLRGWQTEDDNVADALGIWDFASSKMDPQAFAAAEPLLRPTV